MFKTRSKKIFRDVLARKGRSLLVILSIMIGVFGVATMMSITDLLNRQMDEDIKSEQISHTHAYVISGGQPISDAENDAFLETLTGLEGVVDVEGQAVYPTKWLDGDEVEDAVMFAFTEPLGEGNLESISRLIDGRYPEQGEIVVEVRFAEANELEIGDTIRFANTGDQEWEIVGTVLHPYFTFTPTSNTAIEVSHRVFANYADAQQIVGFTGLTAIHVRYENMQTATDGISDLTGAISRETPYVVAFSTQDNPDDIFLTGVVSQMTAAMDALGIIAMIVSGFLVTNVMNTVILEQRRQIGAMKSLGATFVDNVVIYAGMALVYGIIGTTLGLLLAAPIAANTARPVADWASAYIEGYRLSPVGLGVGATMGLIVPVLAALIPVWGSARVSILEAVTDLGISSDWGQSPIARGIGRLPLPIIMVQALSNIWRKKGRLTLTILTLTAAVGAFMGATALAGSLDSFVMESFALYDYHVRINPRQAGDYDQLATLVREDIEGVQAVYPGFDVSVAVEDFTSEMPMAEGTDQVSVYGFDPTTPTFQFDLTDGYAWRDDPDRRGVVISRTVSEGLDKGLGDTLRFDVGGQMHEYEIIGVDAYVFDAMFMNWHELARISGYVDADGQPLVGSAYVVLRGDPSIEAVDDKIDEITALLNANGIRATYENQPQSAHSLAEQAGIMGIVFQMMSIVMAAVGAIGLMAALSMAVFERQKEIGVMRSVGARSLTVAGQFMLEGVFIGLLAWLVAIPISVWMGNGLIDVLPFDYMPLVYPVELVVFGLAGVLFVVALASLWPSLSASRKTVADILRYQ